MSRKKEKNVENILKETEQRLSVNVKNIIAEKYIARLKSTTFHFITRK